MAGLADAATDRCSVASAPALGTWSVCAWIKPVSSASFSPIVRVEAGGGTAMVFGLKSLAPSLYSAASTTGINGTSIGTGTYTFVAATRNGTTAALYWGTNPGSLSKVTGTVNSSGTPDTWTAFGRSPSDGSEWFPGTIAYLRTWAGTVLSDAEVAAEGASATAIKAGTWGNWPFGDNGSGAVSLSDVSGNARHLTAGTTTLTLVADPTLGPIAGSLSMGTTAAVSLGAFATRAASLSVAATAQLGASPVTTRPASLPIASTVQVNTGAFADRAAALSIAATTQLSTAPARTTPATLAIDTTSQLGLVPLADRTAALGVTSVAQLALTASTDRAAALQVATTTAVSVAPLADRAGALVLATAARLDLVPVLERAGALSVTSQAMVQLTAGGAIPAALAVGVTTQLVTAAARTTPAALDATTVAAVLLSSALEQTAALAVVAQAQLSSTAERELASALAIAAVARMELIIEGQMAGSLRLQVGEGRPVRWLAAEAPEADVVVVVGAGAPATWLSSGDPAPT